MSTNGTIARAKGDGFLGVYHHWDSYPTGLGKALWDLHHGHFRGDLPAMLRVLIDDHPAGWSTIVQKDFGIPPGYAGLIPDHLQPQCYCHGERQEKPQAVDQGSHDWLKWAYVFDEEAGTMAVLRREWRKGQEPRWSIVRVMALSGPEPDWCVVECGPDPERCGHYRCLHGAAGCDQQCPFCHGTGVAPQEHRLSPYFGQAQAEERKGEP